MTQMENKKNNKMATGLSIGLALGALAGVVIGIIEKDIALWLSIGIGFAGGLISSNGFNAKNLSGIWETSATKLATAQSAKKIVMYQAKQVFVKREIIKGTIGYLSSTIGSSAISYGLEWLGAY